MANPIGRTFVEIDLDAKKYNKGVVDVKTTTKKKLTEIEKAWKGLGKKSEKTYDDMRAAVNKNYDKIKTHASSTADDIVRAEKAKSEKIARINKQQFGDQKSLIDTAKEHWLALSAVAVAAFLLIQKAITAAIKTIKEWVGLAAKQELAEINLAAALKASGEYTDALNASYQDYASSIQAVTKYGDEEVLTLMALMKNLGVTTDRLEEATKMAIGLATATGRDVQSMAMYIALAEQGEFTMLRRYIPALRATTDATEQMKIITDFAGRGFQVAQTQTESFAVGLVQMRNLWGDLKEKLGDFIIKNELVLDLMKRTKTWLIEVADKVEAWRKANQELIDQKTEEMFLVLAGALEISAKALKNMATELGRLLDIGGKIYSLWDKLPDALKKAFMVIPMVNYHTVLEKLKELLKETGDEAIKNYVKMKISKDVTVTFGEAAIAVNDLKEALALQAEIDAWWEQEKAIIAVTNAESLLMQAVDDGLKVTLESIKEIENRAKLYETGIDAQINAEEDLIKAVEKGMKESVKSYTEAMKDKAEAARDLYKDLKGFEKEYYKYSDELIQAQAQRYRDLGISEVAIAAWVTEEQKKAWRDRTLASDDFFGGMKVGWQDMVDEQTTWAEHGKLLFDDVRSAWKSNVDQMVDDFIKGEKDKRTVAEVTRDILTDVAGQTSKRMYAAAIDKIIEMIGAQLGMGAAGAGAAGSMKGGVTGALAEIGLYLSVGVGAMLAGRAMAEQFAAEGGWIGTHPGGGLIRQGSGVKDDVFLGHTPGIRHWGMGGEYVINKESTAKHGALLEAINRDRGMMTGGYIDRTYQEGGLAIPWKPVADSLFLGTSASFIHGFITKGGLIGALVDAGIFLGTGITAMFAGKLLSSQFHGLGDLLTAPLSPIIGALPSPIGNILGDDINAISDYLNFRTDMMFDPEATWEMIKELIRTPLEAVAKDLVTPGKYYSSPIDTLSNIVDYLKSDATQAEQDLLGELTSFERGGKIPRTGLFYGHKDERVLNKEETRAYEGGGSNRPIHIHLNLDGKEVGLAIVRDGDVVEQMDYQLTKRNKRVYA